MEAKEGSLGFNFEVSYTKVNLGSSFTHTGMGHYFEMTHKAKQHVSAFALIRKCKTLWSSINKACRLS
jgi:hypothetical protein